MGPAAEGCRLHLGRGGRRPPPLYAPLELKASASASIKSIDEDWASLDLLSVTFGGDLAHFCAPGVTLGALLGDPVVNAPQERTQSSTRGPQSKSDCSQKSPKVNPRIPNPHKKRVAKFGTGFVVKIIGTWGASPVLRAVEPKRWPVFICLFSCMVFALSSLLAA
jgi:hypothetical protein